MSDKSVPPEPAAAMPEEPYVHEFAHHNINSICNLKYVYKKDYDKLKELYGSSLSDALMKSNAYNDVLDRAESAEAELARLRPVVEAAAEVQGTNRWMTVEECKRVGDYVSSGNRLASALAAAKEGKV